MTSNISPVQFRQMLYNRTPRAKQRVLSAFKGSFEFWYYLDYKAVTAALASIRDPRQKYTFVSRRERKAVKKLLNTPVLNDVSPV